MRITENLNARISARDRADRLINQLTAGVALAAVGGLGVFAAVGAGTVPGNSSTTASSSTSTTAGTSASTSSSATAIQAATGSVSSSSSTGVAVSGGSH